MLSDSLPSVQAARKAYNTSVGRPAHERGPSAAVGLRPQDPRTEVKMTPVSVTSAKFALPFRAGELPKVDPNDPVIQIRLNGILITARINPKAARKTMIWSGGGVLTGKLVVEKGQLSLSEAGIQFLEPPAPANPAASSAEANAPQEGSRGN